MSIQYQCIKSSIGSVIKHEGLKKEIDRFTEFSSPWHSRGSCLLTLWTVYCYNNNATLPLLKKGSFSTSQLQQVFHPFPSLKGDSQDWKQKDIHAAVLNTFVNVIGWTSNCDPNEVVGYARLVKLISNKYATLLVNHVDANTISYIESTAISFCQSHDLPASRKGPLVQDLVRVIVNYADQPQSSYILASRRLRRKRDEFINYHTRYLDDHDIDLREPLGDQHNKIVIYFVHLLKWQHTVDLGDDRQAALFPVVPMFGVKRYSIPFDPEIMFYLLRGANVPGLPTVCLNEFNNSGQPKNMKAAFFVKEKHHMRFLVYFGGTSKANERRQPNSGDMGSSNGVKASRKFTIDPTVPAGPDQMRKKVHRNLESKYL